LFVRDLAEELKIGSTTEACLRVMCAID